jgi:PBP1b-binding outer membrane lipoprotein LpoB
MRAFIALLLGAFVLSGCGKGKTPESETAVEVGKKPKQTLDKVQGDVEKAMKKEAERAQDAKKE